MAASPSGNDAPGLSRWRILGPFVAAIAVLLGLCIGGFLALSAVRAFVGGESLWSKGRGVALAQLHQYAATGSPEAHARFLAALEVPLGDRQAREELDSKGANFDRARAGFLRGGNHPDDVDGMVWLYHAFSETALMRDAVAAWAEGDRLIAELIATGQQLQQRLAQPDPLSAVEHAALQSRLDELDAQLIATEKNFSASIGVASRRTLAMLEATIVGFAALMACAVIVYAGRLMRLNERSQRQLAESNQRWTLATAGDGIGLFEWQAGGRSVHLDARAGALFGLQIGPGGRAVEVGALREQLHPDDRQDVRDAMDRAAANGTLLKLRYRVRRVDGTLRHVEATGIVQNPGARAPARMLGVLRDVSDEVLRVQLGTEKAAAEQVARARMEFLSRLSHELRTPLNAVLGFSQLLLMEQAHPLPADAQVKVRHIETAGKHLLRLVEDVLNITRIDAGQSVVHMQALALQPLLDAALLLVEVQRQALGVVVSADLPAAPLQVMGDRQRLEQVFVNLLSNGCKYNRPAGALNIAHRIDGAQVLLSFADEGQGLDADEIGQLFQPFRRLYRHAAIEGTGLGLVIVKQLLVQMGGDIEVASVKGQGSVFTVRLALATRPG